VLVVKLGGRVGPGAVLDEIARLDGRPVVLVHGGGPQTDALSARLGAPVVHVRAPDGTRSRRTDAAALETLAMALLGQVKPVLVDGLRRRGVRAVGLSGGDAGLVVAERKPAIKVVENGRTRVLRDDLSGRITALDPRVLRLLLADGIVPVVSPPAAAAAGGWLNVDADRMAAALAVALGARELVYLTDVLGVLRDPADPATLVPRMEVPVGPEFEVVAGRMRHKVRAAAEALAGGVDVVVMSGDGGASPIGDALRGAGTTFVPRRAS
jgi:acetylglutamate/LysW-gamma-L-alpha-aminoadipate kinase